MPFTQEDQFASSQILLFNPILQEPLESRIQYYIYLEQLIRLANWKKQKFTKAQLSFYRETLCQDQDSTSQCNQIVFGPNYYILLPFDLAAHIGFRTYILNSQKVDLLAKRISTDYSLLPDQITLLFIAFSAALGNPVAWNELLNAALPRTFKEYLAIVRQNICYIQKRPFNILVTATMSAGKSTLVNSLVGKRICRTQNMACTSKLHRIVSKPFDDGVTSAHDHLLSMNVQSNELMHVNVRNHSPRITVSTFFDSALAGKRIVLIDSPGVNSSENPEHAQIAHQTIQSGKIQLMLYVLNATALSTNDEEQHLKWIRQRLGQKKVIFVLNKVDKLISEKDDLMGIIQRQKAFLTSLGYSDPLICPVSSQAAYLAKKNMCEGLSRWEQHELENFIDAFEPQSLSGYYEQHLHCPACIAGNETEALLANCGFSYLETIIANTYKQRCIK